MPKSIYVSPIGHLLLEADDKYITGLNFINEEDDTFCVSTSDILKYAENELDKYFEGELRTFTVAIKYSDVSDFRRKCYEELLKIPFGETISYKELAIRIDNPKAVRAVGGANHNNNISIFVPCHRVIGSTGNLTGYGGGLWRKKWLIEHENKYKIRP